MATDLPETPLQETRAPGFLGLWPALTGLGFATFVVAAFVLLRLDLPILHGLLPAAVALAIAAACRPAFVLREALKTGTIYLVAPTERLRTYVDALRADGLQVDSPEAGRLSDIPVWRLVPDPLS